MTNYQSINHCQLNIDTFYIDNNMDTYTFAHQTIINTKNAPKLISPIYFTGQHKQRAHAHCKIEKVLIL